ncbi:MAG: AMP-binding protein, partial [Longimicrobiales bacterium]
MSARHHAYNMALVFEGVVERNPDAVALRMGPSDAVTYGQLNALANRIARSLAADGIERQDVVGILSEKVP